MFLFRMAGPGRDLFYPPSGFIILYVLNGVIKDPAIKTKVKKDPGQQNKIPNPNPNMRFSQHFRNGEVEICIVPGHVCFTFVFGCRLWKKAWPFAARSGNLHFAWACFPIHPILFFYLIAFRVRVVQSDIVWECVLEPIIHFVNY